MCKVFSLTLKCHYFHRPQSLRKAHRAESILTLKEAKPSGSPRLLWTAVSLPALVAMSSTASRTQNHLTSMNRQCWLLQVTGGLSPSFTLFGLTPDVGLSVLHMPLNPLGSKSPLDPVLTPQVSPNCPHF